MDNEEIQGLIAELPQLEGDQQQVLDSSITAEELEAAMRSLTDGKASGIDGLAVEFYKVFWTLVAPDLLHVLEECIRVGELPLSCSSSLQVIDQVLPCSSGLIPHLSHDH